MFTGSKKLFAIASAALLSLSLSGCITIVAPTETEPSPDTSVSKEYPESLDEKRDKMLERAKNSEKDDSKSGEPGQPPKEADAAIESFFGDYFVTSEFFADGASTQSIFKISSDLVMTAHYLDGVKAEGEWYCDHSISGSEATLRCDGDDGETYLELYFVKFGSGSSDVSMVGQGYIQGGDAFASYSGDKQ